jgi:outer membrane protein OmpA-like peptidoglycan-associated protein
MHGSRYVTVSAVALAFALSAPLAAQTDHRRPVDGDVALHSHGHSHIHVIAPVETAMQPTPIATQPDVDSLALADSLRNAGLATARADSARADSAAARVSAALHAELATPVHFDFDQDRIPSADGAILDRKAAILTANPSVRLRISGYCDERGTAGYNVALGGRRAAAVKQHLIDRGVDADRLEAQSLGSASPIDAGRTEAAWAMNRRAGFQASSAAPLAAPLAAR